MRQAQMILLTSIRRCSLACVSNWEMLPLPREEHHRLFRGNKPMIAAPSLPRLGAVFWDKIRPHFRTAIGRIKAALPITGGG